MTTWTFAGHELTLAADEDGLWVLRIDGEIAATKKGKRPNKLWCHTIAFRLY